MATEPQSTSHGTRQHVTETSVWNVYLSQNMGGREGGKSKQVHVSNKVTQAKAHGNAPANLPGVPPDITGETAAFAWF